MAGRKLLLDTALIDSIANWLKLGYYQEDAAIMAGISESTFYKWMKKANELDQLDEEPDNEDDKLFLQLLQAVKKARAESEGAHIRNISCLLYTSPSPRDATLSRMPSSA